MDAHTKAQMEALAEMFGAYEDLHPDLVPWLDEDGPLGSCLRHPLVYSIAHSPVQNAMVNRRFEAQLKAKNEALKAGNWRQYVWLFERPWRLEAFASISWHLEGPNYWEMLGQVWSDTENAWQNMDEWHELLTADPEGREMMSSPDVRCVFSLPPEQGGLLPMTQVYRGYCHDSAAAGFSWTLDKARARWFAGRLRDKLADPPARIISGQVAREHVLAYITSRDEQEIVCLPENVINQQIEEA